MSTINAKDWNSRLYHHPETPGEHMPPVAPECSRAHARIVLDVDGVQQVIEAIPARDATPEDKVRLCGLQVVLPHPAHKGPFSWSDPSGHMVGIRYGTDPVYGRDTVTLDRGPSVVTFLWSIVEGELFAGLIEERRATRVSPENPEGWTVTPCAGLVDPGKDVRTTSDLEVAQEIGVCQGETILLAGEPINQCVAWIVNPLDPESGTEQFHGISVAAREIDARLLEVDPDEPGHLRFKAEALGARQEDHTPNAGLEKIGVTRFYPFEELVKLGAGWNQFIARLLGHLIETGRLTFNWK